MKTAWNFKLLFLVLLLVGMTAWGCTAPGEEQEESMPIVVSSKTFAEALTMGEMTVELLRDRGYEVVDEVGLGEVAVIRPAIESGQVDVYWEYTGTGLMNLMEYGEVVTDPAETFQLVKEWDKEHHNLVWLDYAPANNTFVLFISRNLWEEQGWSQISELAAYVGDGEQELKLATPAEWTERIDGLPNFQEHYGFRFRESDLEIVELGLAYEAVGRDLAQVGIGDATEGRIAYFDLVVLEDDKQFFPAYNPAPVIRQEVLDVYPELEEVFQELSSLLDAETLVMLNKRVTVEGKQPDEVARDYLREQNLISAP